MSPSTLRYFLRPLLLILCVLCLTGCQILYDYWGGNFKGEPHEMDANISPGAKNLIKQALDIQGVIVDHQVHVIARGTTPESQDAYIAPQLYTYRHPLWRMKTRGFMSASGVTDYDKLDEQYNERLFDLIAHFQDVQQKHAPAGSAAHFYIYAMEYYYNEDGTPNKERTDLHVPNDYVINLADRFNRDLQAQDKSTAVVVPVISVHPYRSDFAARVAELAEQVRARGYRVFMKWLPGTMNIDMRLIPPAAYQALKDQDITVFTHTGNEHVIRVFDDNQLLNDPLLLRYALEQGVRVVALHAGVRGSNSLSGERNHKRFVDMMSMEAFRDKMFGELSVTNIVWSFTKEVKQPIENIIELTQQGGLLAGRMINGTDYPVIALSLVNTVDTLAEMNMLTKDEAKWLTEIYSYNPLLFDFVTKRTIRHPTTGEKLPKEAFMDLVIP